MKFKLAIMEVLAQIEREYYIKLSLEAIENKKRQKK